LNQTTPQGLGVGMRCNAPCHYARVEPCCRGG
jgi:hypothetical protein